MKNTDRIYFVVTGFIFTAVFCLHLLRIINHWVATIGPWTVPLWFSWWGLILSGGLCLWAFRLAR